MDTTPKYGSYSARVSADLFVGDHRLALGAVGPEDCMVRQPIAIAPSEAEIVLRVDDDEFRYPVFLSEGISPGQNRVAFERRD